MTILTAMAEDDIFKGGDTVQEMLLNGINVRDREG